MNQHKEALLRLIASRSFKSGRFQLASGDISDYYIDGRLSEVYSESAYLIGEVLYETTADLKFDALGGLESGAIPLTTAAVISYHLHGRILEGFWVRSAAKTHGMKKSVEGNLRPGQKVVVLDDVITRGESSLKAISAVREMGCEVIAVVALVDRLQGAADLFKQNGIPEYRQVFTVDDLRAAVKVAPPSPALAETP